MRSASGITPGTRCWRRSTPCWAGRRSMPVEVVAFCCFYCAYAAADLAGVMRLSYPPNVRVVLLPCTGGVDPLYILRAFEAGADGGFVAGRLEGAGHQPGGKPQAKSRGGS